MRYSKSILVLLVLTLFALTACSSGQQTTSNNPYIGGTKAVDMSFISGAPPAQVFDDKQGSFQVTVQLKNVGESDINDNTGYVQIEGIAPQEFGVETAAFKQTMPAIKGAKKSGSGTVTAGQQQLVTFGPLTYQRGISGVSSNTIIATACYNYATQATADICVKKDGIDDPSKKTSVCSIEGNKPASNSAGPVQISKVTQVPLGNQKVQVQFDIGIASSSKTDLFFKKDTNCLDSQTNFDKYKVYVKVNPIVNELYPASCMWQDGTRSAAGYVTLFEGATQSVQCVFNVGNVQTDYKTPFNVELQYRYMQQIQTPILIKDVSVNTN